MAQIDRAAQEVVAKVVYYGPALAGKTTNLQSIYDTQPADRRSALFPIPTVTGRSLIFDFLAPGLGTLYGMNVRVQLCSVDGPVSAEPTRRALLRSADAVVFVVDSQAAAMDHNITCLESLQRILLAARPELPLVLQYNKRDLPTVLPLEILNLKLNPSRHPAFEAIAHKGVGVAETLRVVSRRCYKALAALDAEALAAGGPHRRPTARFKAPEALRAAGKPEREEETRPLRLPTDQSLARESLYSAPENRHLTIPAMSREAFAAAAARRDTIPAIPREGSSGAEDRYATLPAAPREQFGRPQGRHDAVPAGPVRPAPTGPVKDDEETRPLRFATSQSLARESLESSQPPGSRAGSPEPTDAAEPGPPPPNDERKPTASRLAWLRKTEAAPEPTDAPSKTPRQKG